MNSMTAAMFRTAAGSTILCLASISADARTEKEKLVRENWAELSAYSVGGIGGQCSGLIDVKFGMVNGDRPQSVVPDENIYLEKALFDRLYEQGLQEAVGVKNVQVLVNGKPVRLGADAARSVGSQQAAAWHRYAQEKVNAYGQQRRDKLFRYMDDRPDIVAAENFAHFTYENNAIAKHHVAQRTLTDCYAASLATAFSYLGLKGSISDFVNRRNGVCPKLQGSDRSATYGEIRAAVRSTVLDKQTPAFDFSLPAQSQGFLQRRVFRQQYLKESIVSDNTRQFFITPNPALIGNLVGIFSPSLGRQLPSVGRSSIPPLPQVQMQPFVDKNGAAINLWETWRWHRTANPKIGGYLWPMRSTGDLISAVIGGDAVLVGYGGESAGHTVLITGIRFTPRVKYDENGVYFTARSIVHDVRVLDPLVDGKTEYWLHDMDKFFREYRFGFALADGVAN